MSIDAKQLKSRLSTSALAFRGYDQKNLGRTPELLAHSVYGPIIRQHLEEASQICSDVMGRRVNLVTRVRRRRETTLKTYHEAVALVVAMELAQLRLLQEFFDIDYHDAKMAYGFSLGEIAAVVAGGAVAMGEALRYNDYNAGDILCKWTDHPQLLWKAIEETFVSGIQTVIHIGPAPNLIPATFQRVAANVESQTRNRMGGTALASVVCPWLRSLLPRTSSLLCAPRLEHVILEDWLLEQPPVGRVSDLSASDVRSVPTGEFRPVPSTSSYTLAVEAT